MRYYCSNENNQSVGPYSAEDLHLLRQQGAIADDTPVIAEGATEWETYAALFLVSLDAGQQEVQTQRCERCGAENREGAPSCEGCGLSFDGMSEPVSAQEPESYFDESAHVNAQSKSVASVSSAGTRGFSKHAFISHSSRDHRFAEQVCNVLEGHGLKCWIAPRDIDPGKPYDEEILRGIERSQTFILLLSDAANASPHVKRELMVALRAGHAVYPIRIQEVQPGPKLEYLLEGIHWVDAWTPPIEAHLDRLALLIAESDPKAAASQLGVKRSRMGRALWQLRWRGRSVLVGIAVTALVLLSAAWVAINWNEGVVSGIVSYLTRQVDSQIKGTRGGPSAELTEKARRSRYEALVAAGKDAANDHRWAAAVTAYEAALALFDEAETRSALAQAESARDLEQATARKRDAFSRLLADAEQAEKSGDFTAAQSIYERAAAAAPTETERAQAQEKARVASGGLAYQKKRAGFDELMLTARQAESKEEWQDAADAYAKALAAAPDEALAEQARTCKSRMVAILNEQALHRPEVNQTITLCWLHDTTAVKSAPSSEQIVDNIRHVVGEASLDGTDPTQYGGLFYSATLSFKTGKKTVPICVFRCDDAVKQTRVGQSDGLFFVGNVLEIKRNGYHFYGEGSLESLKIQVTVSSKTSTAFTPATAITAPAEEVPVQAMANVLKEPLSQPAAPLDPPKQAVFDDLMEQGKRAEESKDWQNAKDIYVKALAAAPDADAAARVRVCGSRVMACMKGQGQEKPPASQTVTLGLSSRRVLASTPPSSAFIRSAAGEKLGIVSMTADNFNTIGSVALTFKGAATTAICTFRGSEPVGTTKVGETEKLTFSATLIAMTTGKNGSSGDFIKTISVRVTATERKG